MDIPEKKKVSLRGDIWEAIRQYTRACGGDPERMDNLDLQKEAVNQVEQSLYDYDCAVKLYICHQPRG